MTTDTIPDAAAASAAEKPAAKPARVKPAAKAAAKAAPKAASKAGAKPVAKPALVRVPAPPSAAGVVAAAKPAAKPVKDKDTTALKLRDLVDQVVKATGAKKKGMKEVVVATLAALGDALTRGDDLNLPPLGKAKVGRQKDQAGGELIVVKLRRGGANPAGGKAAKEGLAAAEE